MKPRSSRTGERLLVRLGVIWAIAVVIGLCMLFQYQTTAGVIGKPVERWPAGSRVVPAEGRAHLVMVAHPRCPCTRASINALARIMAHAQDRATATVLFLRPKSAAIGWEQTDLWRSAAAIPGVQVVCDDGGNEATRFGVESSGHVLLYDRNGWQRFSGGITAGRGHFGDNAGLDHCIAFIDGRKTDRHDTPVFGCSLREPMVGDVRGAGLCRKTK